MKDGFLIGKNSFKEFLFRGIELRQRASGDFSFPHILMPLPEGSGRTTLLRYTVHRLREIRCFPNLDDYIELELHEGREGLAELELDLTSSSVYCTYSGLVGVDVNVLKDMTSDRAYIKSLSRILKQYASTATFIFFVDPNNSMERVINRLTEIFDGWLSRLPPEPYNEHELCEILAFHLRTLGVKPERIDFSKLSIGDYTPARLKTLSRQLAANSLLQVEGKLNEKGCVGECEANVL